MEDTYGDYPAPAYGGGGYRDKQHGSYGHDGTRPYGGKHGQYQPTPKPTHYDHNNTPKPYEPQPHPEIDDYEDYKHKFINYQWPVKHFDDAYLVIGKLNKTMSWFSMPAVHQKKMKNFFICEKSMSKMSHRIEKHAKPEPEATPEAKPE